MLHLYISTQFPVKYPEEKFIAFRDDSTVFLIGDADPWITRKIGSPKYRLNLAIKNPDYPAGYFCRIYEFKKVTDARKFLAEYGYKEKELKERVKEIDFSTMRTMYQTRRLPEEIEQTPNCVECNQVELA